MMKSPLCFLCMLSFTFRFQLNCKKSKVDEYPMRKSNAFPAQQLMSQLSSDSNSENLKDDTCKMPLSKSLVGGNMNVCKTRILNFVQTERVLQGELTFKLLNTILLKLNLVDSHN